MTNPLIGRAEWPQVVRRTHGRPSNWTLLSRTSSGYRRRLEVGRFGAQQPAASSQVMNAHRSRRPRGTQNQAKGKGNGDCRPGRHVRKRESQPDGTAGRGERHDGSRVETGHRQPVVILLDRSLTERGQEGQESNNYGDPALNAQCDDRQRLVLAPELPPAHPRALRPNWLGWCRWLIQLNRLGSEPHAPALPHGQFHPGALFRGKGQHGDRTAAAITTKT